jgi:hypothetical protein
VNVIGGEMFGRSNCTMNGPASGFPSPGSM